MKCLTPEKALSGDGNYLAANLYAKSIFGEDALANLSIEKAINKDDAAVTGHIRIRSKSQVIISISILIIRSNSNILTFLLQVVIVGRWSS